MLRPVGLRAPPSLRPGSTIAVVAPASPFDRDELFRGLAWLRTRYRLRLRPDVLSRAGYLAGDDARRARELADAMTEPEVSAILAARGGYGSMRIVDALPWDALARAPKWLAGFSDVTALHVEAARRGVCTIHAPNATGLGRAIAASERASFVRALERPEAEVVWSELRVIRPAPDGAPRAGVAAGGNLALVCAMAAAGRLFVPDGAVFLLEDVTERPYRIDRMLTSLALGGFFARAAAIVFGGFHQCEPGPDGVTADDVLDDLATRVACPVLAGAPFGHGAPNHAFVLGRTVAVDARARGAHGAVTWTAGA
jgi:muramoyltetrapeptide carboxypeptidase